MAPSAGQLWIGDRSLVTAPTVTRLQAERAMERLPDLRLQRAQAIFDS
jgi:hypothetical protein